MRTTLDIDSHLLKRLRDEAHRRGVPLKELLTTTLQRGLEGGARGKRVPYRCPTYAMGAVGRPLNIDKALAMAAALEDEETGRKLSLRK